MKNIYFLLYFPAIILFFLLSLKIFQTNQLVEKTKNQEFIFYVSSEFSEEEIQSIILSIKGWNYFLNSNPNLQLGSDIELYDEFDYDGISENCFNENMTIIKFDKYFIQYDDIFSMLNNLNILGYTEINQKLGRCNFRNITITDYNFVNEYVSFDYKLTNVIMHEIGHALDLKHIKNENSIMSEYYLQTTTFFTEYDVEEYCKHYFCDKKIMRYMHIEE